MTQMVRAHPVLSYFLVTFMISWGLAFVVASPELLVGKAISRTDGILMFPAMEIGPIVTGLVLTRLVDGKEGMRDLVSRMRKWKVGSWYLSALIPPSIIILTLLILSSFVSSVYTPNFFVYGIGFGVLAGYVEEIGWTGYAIKKLFGKHSTFTSAIMLGALWGLWHAPVVDFLGAAYPHGEYWLPFYLSFIAIVMAIRVLIVWIYANTKSVLSAQVMHASFTGSLAVFAPAAVLPAQEAGWYAICAGFLWLVVALIVARLGKQLSPPRKDQPKSLPNGRN